MNFLNKIAFLSVFCFLGCVSLCKSSQEDDCAQPSPEGKRYALSRGFVAGLNGVKKSHIDHLSASAEECMAGVKRFKAQGDVVREASCWVGAALKGYCFSVEEMFEFVRTFSALDDDQTACQVWQCIFEKWHQSIQPEWYTEGAAAALNAGNYSLAFRWITKHLQHSEEIKPIAHLVAAQAAFFTDKPETAAKNYGEFIALENPGAIPAVVYLNAAKSNYLIKNYKTASKFMDCFFSAALASEKGSDEYKKAATYALLNNEIEKSITYFLHFFSMPDAQNHETFNYAKAGFAFFVKGDYESAVEYHEKYFELTPEKEWMELSVFTMAKTYLLLHDLKKACSWYDVIFARKNPNSKGLSDLPLRSFHEAAVAYLACQDIQKVETVLRIATKYHAQPTSVYVGSSLTSKKMKNARKKKDAPARKGRNKPKSRNNGAELIRVQLRSTLLEKCDAIKGSLERMSFEGECGLEAVECERQEMIGEIAKLHQSALSTSTTLPVDACVSSSPSCVDVPLVSLQQAAIRFEAKQIYLQHLYDELTRQRKKRRAVEYLASLNTLEEEYILLPEDKSQKNHYGHAKQIVLTASKEPSIEHPSQDHTAHVRLQPQVTFRLLKKAQKEYEEMKNIPGMRGKYKCFIQELLLDPLKTAGASGRPEKLHASEGLFSRRFDKGNRFVYKVFETEENVYDVLILSLFGHYKDLDHQLKTLNKH